ncbi:MAG: Type I Iterative PKS [Bathelium mastoideum]|nr:MAG: Type I Iterative PKS [Bathelium mastoideum]
MPVLPQKPVAIIGISCRLPGYVQCPQDLWNLLDQGVVAENHPPASRFTLDGHYNGSRKPRTMRSPGGMFLESVDPRDIDASFFGLSAVEAAAMDPQQRQMLEVVYEALESAGIDLARLDGQAFGCFVGSFASDYADMQARDPEDRVAGVTVGVGRAMLSNRISHFLNIKGTSMTIDTACSGSLVSLDTACHYLQSGDIDGAIVGACNLYLNPEHNMDTSSMQDALSPSGRCHTFDAKADGYIKAEAANALVLKRLSDAVRDGDPVRAIILGSASNSDGWTPGIASPNKDAQVAAILKAYSNAGISNFDETGYVECHGTGTPTGDPIEVSSVGAALGSSRSSRDPLRIGSIKANIGHSEPASGLSGILKCILAMEHGVIPGNPTFDAPNPLVDFASSKTWTSKVSTPWPRNRRLRASVNSFGYGGTNCHVILDLPNADIQKHVSSYNTNVATLFDEPAVERLRLLAFSANDWEPLTSNIGRLRNHLLNPAVSVNIGDLAYTLSQRRTRHFHRGFAVTGLSSLQDVKITYGKKSPVPPRIAFVFTGQGAQWSQMGSQLLELFPEANRRISELERALRPLSNAPAWSIKDELTQPRTSEHMRLPVFSQTLVTALQILLIDILASWSIRPHCVVGHSSGEIAAAYSQGSLSAEDAIKIAYLRGELSTCASQASDSANGMMAAGISAADALQQLDDINEDVRIACFNSSESITFAGELKGLDRLHRRLQAHGAFSRLLRVNMAYHTHLMADIGEDYRKSMEESCSFTLEGNNNIKFFSSVEGSLVHRKLDATYFADNMTSQVFFDDAMRSLLETDDPPTFVIEIGPHNALAGPIQQILNAAQKTGTVQYHAAWKRGSDNLETLLKVAGHVFLSGGNVDLGQVNRNFGGVQEPRTIVDLPNYAWNHNKQYWYENESSQEWRTKQFAHHDLLGSKVLGTPWKSPTWKKSLRLQDLAWLRDHKLGPDCTFPAAGYIAMAVEAVRQTHWKNGREKQDLYKSKNAQIRLRDIKLTRALVVKEDNDNKIMLSMSARGDASDGCWYDFSIASNFEDVRTEHCAGVIRIEAGSEQDVLPDLQKRLERPHSAQLWYKAMRDVGYTFGPAFQSQRQIDSVAGQSNSKSLVDFAAPESQYPQSFYLIHPAPLDSCLQTAAPSLWAGHRTDVDRILVPVLVDNMVIKVPSDQAKEGLAVSSRHYKGVGRFADPTSYSSNIAVYNSTTGFELLRLSGLQYGRLPTSEKAEDSVGICKVLWKPDMSFVSYRNQDPYLSAARETHDGLSSKLKSSDCDILLDLAAHKHSDLRVLEVNLLQKGSESMWLSRGQDNTALRPFQHLTLVIADSSAVHSYQTRLGSDQRIRVELFDSFVERADVSDSQAFDCCIIHRNSENESPHHLIDKLKLFLKDTAWVLQILRCTETLSNGFSNTRPGKHVAHMSNELDDLESDTQDTILDQSVSSWESRLLTRVSFDSHWASTTTQLFLPRVPLFETDKAVSVISLCEISRTSESSKLLQAYLREQGWNLTTYQISEYDFPSFDAELLVIADEIDGSLLTSIRSDTWKTLQRLVQAPGKKLWLTSGGTHDVNTPEMSMIFGMARTLRAEDPKLTLLTLDLDPNMGKESFEAVDAILQRMNLDERYTLQDTEFVERRGVLYINRISVDRAMSSALSLQNQGHDHVAEESQRSFHDTESQISLRSERLGVIDSLRWCEVHTHEVPLEQNNFVEVEIYAAGLNFKDVSVVMGLVPENQYLLGLEASGVIKRVGPKAYGYKLGDRVVIIKRGTFANRLQVSVDGTHKIPDWMSFEEAATLAVVYGVSILALFDLADVKAGQRVLIHSGSGGVGIAAIQLCKYLGADIFTTAGTPEKRVWLSKRFGIPSQNIFDSRSVHFAGQLLERTAGKGVDVILNSSTGALLDESWRCIADGGIMIEIGKRDILERNSLSMEPFGRNASFRAIDMSHPSVPDSTIARVLGILFKLIEEGNITAIAPIENFSYHEIAAAFRCMRAGNHIGKIVISNGSNRDFSLPVYNKIERVRLRSDSAYIIVGGLKGLCGSVARWFARRGARQLVIMSRSGISDDESQWVARDTEELGCQTLVVKGDVSVLDDVRSAFRRASAPVVGIVQGAMVLRDKIFPSMTEDDFSAATVAKVQGTRNLHQAAKEQEQPLDFFTMLSSLSGLVGQKAQANYAAANAFLDSFAHYRRALGLPGLSIDLGIIEDVGYIAERPELAARLNDTVWSTGINERTFLGIIERAILEQTQPQNKRRTVQLVTGLSVPQQSDSELVRDVRFSSLISGSAARPAADGNDSAREVQAISHMIKSNVQRAAVLDALSDLVGKHIAKYLGITEIVEPARDLSNYGIDSLAAVEIRNWLRLELQAELTTLEISSASSLYALCEKVLDRMTAE